VEKCIRRTRGIITAVSRQGRREHRGARQTSRTTRDRTARSVIPSAAAIALGLVLINLFVYSSVRRFDLVNWDDATYITENPTVLGGLSWSSAWWALTTGHSPYWHPMTWLSHLLDVSLFGTDAGAYHVTNLVLHIASTLLLFDIFCRMTGAIWRSAFVAAIFAVHPLHAESVAWIAERKDVLSTLFWMLTVAAYIRYVKHPGWRRYTFVMLAYALALMSKPMVVTLPAVLLLLDVWPLRRLPATSAAPGSGPAARTRNVRILLEKAPLLALALATSVATVIIQHRVGAMAGLTALPWKTRAGNATIGYVAYLWKTIWPTRLAAFYPLFEITTARVAGAALILAAITVAVIGARRRHPHLFVGWFWYVITIAPVIGLLQAGEQGMADRFMYVPMIGLSIMAAWSADALAFRRTASSGLRRHARWMTGALVVVICAFAARAQVAHWENSIALWSHAARVTPRSYIAHENLGQALREGGQLEESKASYQRALQFAPPNSPGYAAVIHNSIGMVLTRQGRIREASEAFAAAVHTNPGFAEAQTNLANTLAADGFEAAVRINPRFAEAQTNLANTLASQGQPAQAIPHYAEAIRLKPDYIEPLVGLGGALLRLGRTAEAVPRYRAALKLDPALAEAHNGLGGALATEGHDEEAMAEYREALRLKPELATAHLNIALLLVKRGDVAEARRHLETALSIDPEYAPARQALRAIAGETR
jgi:tetratricopeptide (TPR) repeat protein